MTPRILSAATAMLVAATAFATPCGAQADRLELLYDSAYFNWDAGDYPLALRQLQRLLESPASDSFLPRAAELTGEVYVTVELAPDGRALRWSADGRTAAFESGTGTDRTSHVFQLTGDGVRRVAEVNGFALALSPDGERAAYLALADGGALEAELAALDARAQAENMSNQVRNRERLLIEGRHARLIVLDLASAGSREVASPPLTKLSLAFGADSQTLYVEAAAPGQTDGTDIYVFAEGQTARPLTEGPGIKSNPRLVPGGRHLTHTLPSVGSGTAGARFALISLAEARSDILEGASPTFSADGGTMAFLTAEGGETRLAVATLTDGGPRDLRTIVTSLPPTNPTVSPDGRTIAMQGMPFNDWEIYTIGVDGQNETRITRDIQHDILPQWLGSDRLFAVVGESRHRRSFMYGIADQQSARLHHNNSLRTVAPEYEWAVSPDGSRILIVADRDGNTISPERGVYLMDLTKPVPRGEVQARLATNLAAELHLRERGATAFAPIADAVRDATAEVATGRIYSYAHAVYQFDSKNITQPGNLKAIEYYDRMLRSFGYEPELQWYEPRPGIRSANIVATLRGTVNPELIYIVSSHFDSVERGPGADDNSSGSTALLEAARVLANRPQSATIRFAWLTGEESGLLGAREFVRRAVESGDHLVGVLNNDMVGWSGNHRLDNTIRYSNDGIRDIQHAAAQQFTDLITYDARYYRSTDAGVFYEQYGDIVGGIGSYPILSSPYYHQPNDILSNINQPLVAEVSKTTVATIMLLASSPSRPTGLQARRNGGNVELTWDPSPEMGVNSYIVAYRGPGDMQPRTVTVEAPRATLPDVPAGSTLEVKAVGPLGMRSWDWARLEIDR
jgi:Tol biopolymer transport system component